MKRERVYRAWAPDGDPWRPWVKPVLFAALEDEVTPTALDEAPAWVEPRVIAPLEAAAAPGDEANPYRDSRRGRDTAVVVDLPGAAGALVGVALARHGFRPVPLYNAVPAPTSVPAVVDVRPIMDVLGDAAQLVEALPHGLPPAFLVDADRMGRGRSPSPGSFDNRSTCRASDFPSAEVLLRSGIRRVALIRTHGAVDLDAVIVAWQKRGLAVWAMDGSGEEDLKPIVVRERPWFLRVADLARRALLSRRSDGSYGMMVPHPQGG